MPFKTINNSDLIHAKDTIVGKLYIQTISDIKYVFIKTDTSHLFCLRRSHSYHIDGFGNKIMFEEAPNGYTLVYERE